MELSQYAPDRIIEELVAAENFGQALNNIEQGLKKHPGDAILSAFKAAILYKLGHNHDSQKTCLEILRRKPPPTDRNTLAVTFYTASSLKGAGADIDDKDFRALWVSAIDQQQNLESKEALAKQWISLSIKLSEWASVAKATKYLEKVHTRTNIKARTYWFWNIVANYLAGWEDPDPKSIHRQLARRMLSKAVDNVPLDAAAEPGNWICSSSELTLFCDAFLVAGRPADVMNALNHVILSHVTRNDYRFEMTRHNLISALLEPDSLFEWSSQRIENAIQTNRRAFLDCWNVWRNVLTSVSRTLYQMQDKSDADMAIGLIVRCENLLQRVTSEVGSLRSPNLARVELLWLKEMHTLVNGGKEDNDARDHAFKIASEYFITYADKSFAVKDLEYRVMGLDSLEFSELRNRFTRVVYGLVPDATASATAQLKWIKAETNALALDLDYVTEKLIKLNEDVDGAIVRILEEFVISCIELYKAAKTHAANLAETDLDPSDAPIVLAAKALACISTSDRCDKPFSQAAFLLEALLESSEHNYEARIQQFASIQSLGLHSLAWDSYQHLTIKEILFETMSPLMFNGIAMAHPMVSAEFDPYTEIENVLRFYERSEARLASCQELALEWHNYHKVVQMNVLLRRMQQSKTRWMLALERRRIARIRGVAYDSLDNRFQSLRMPMRWPPSISSRESLRYNDGSIQPSLNEDTLLFLCCVDDTFNLLLPAVEYNASDLGESKRRWEVLGRRLRSGGALTFLHNSFYNLYEQLREVALIMIEQPCKIAAFPLRSVRDTIAEAWNEHLSGLYEERTATSPIPGCVFYQTAFTFLEFLQGCVRLADKATVMVRDKSFTGTAKDKQDCIAMSISIKSVAEQRTKCVHDLARCLQTHASKAVQTSTFLSRTLVSDNVEDKLGQAIQSVVGKERMRVIEKRFIESVKDALEGIRRVGVTRQ